MLQYFKTKNLKKFWGGAQFLPLPIPLDASMACDASTLVPSALAPSPVQKS